MSPRTRRQTGKIPVCYMKLSVELNSFRLYFPQSAVTHSRLIFSQYRFSLLTLPHLQFASLCLVCVISHSVLPVILFTREAWQIPCN